MPMYDTIHNLIKTILVDSSYYSQTSIQAHRAYEYFFVHILNGSWISQE